MYKEKRVKIPNSREIREILIKIHYLWKTNTHTDTHTHVVICFHFSIFEPLETAMWICYRHYRGLWFAFILVSLNHWKQRTTVWRLYWNRCDLLSFVYICNSQKYFVWLSVYYMKLAWEWATDKKNANCLESLYSSCCQITLYLSAKIMFFLWIPKFSGYNLHGDFKNNPNQEWHLYRSRVHVTHRQR